MNPKQVLKGIAVLALVGVAVDAAYAETSSNEPATEVHAIDSNAPAEVKIQVSQSNPTTASAEAESQAASQDAEHEAPVAAEVPVAKPGILERAMTGVANLFERAKAFVVPSDK